MYDLYKNSVIVGRQMVVSSTTDDDDEDIVVNFRARSSKVCKKRGFTPCIFKTRRRLVHSFSSLILVRVL